MTATPGASNTDTQEEVEASAETMQSPAPHASLDDETVAAYLKEHPEFFINHAELLLHLEIPHESGKAISLLERQVAVFRDKQEQLEGRFQDFLSNARVNDNLFEKTRLVILDLLQCSSLKVLTETIAKRIRTDFDANISELAFIRDEADLQHPALHSISTETVGNILGEGFEKQRTWCGRLSPEQQSRLFSEPCSGNSGSMISAAIVPLHLPEDAELLKRYGQPLLLIGSTEQHHFNSSLDTLFLDFIGEVLSAHLQNLSLND